MGQPLKTREIRQYRRALRQFQRLNGAQLKNGCCGVTLAQCLILLDINEHHRLTMGQLASNLRLDQSTLSRTVEGLVRKKLLIRLTDKRDRRVVWIGLTKQGASTCQEIHESNDKNCLQVFKRIPAKDRGEVIRYFEILVQAYLDNETAAEQKECGSQPGKNPVADLA